MLVNATAVTFRTELDARRSRVRRRSAETDRLRCFQGETDQVGRTKLTASSVAGAGGYSHDRHVIRGRRDRNHHRERACCARRVGASDGLIVPLGKCFEAGRQRVWRRRHARERAVAGVAHFDEDTPAFVLGQPATRKARCRPAFAARRARDPRRYSKISRIAPEGAGAESTLMAWPRSTGAMRFQSLCAAPCGVICAPITRAIASAPAGLTA